MSDDGNNTESKDTNFFKSYSRQLLGVVGLYFGVILSIAVGNEVSSILENEGWHVVSIYVVEGFVMSLFFLALSWLLSLTIEGRWVNKLERQVRDLTNEHERLSNQNSLLEQLTPRLQTTAEQLQEQQKSLEKIGQIVLLEEFPKIQRRFMDVTGLVNNQADRGTLKIIGTSLGTYGRGSIGLAEQLFYGCNSIDFEPFEEAFFAVPGHCNGDHLKEIDKYHSVYPFSARVSAGKILLEIVKRAQNNQCKISSRRPYQINLSFINQLDVFPAIQLWGKKYAMILASTGIEDRTTSIGKTSVTEALPVSIVMKSGTSLSEGNRKANIDKTLERLDSHLEKDYGLGLGESRFKKEIWSVNSASNIGVTGFVTLSERESFLNLAQDHNFPNADSKRLKEILSSINPVNHSFVQEDFEELIRLIERAAELIVA